MLQNYVATGTDDLDMVTNLVGKVIESGSWREFTTPNGFPVAHSTFQSFVTADRWDGLGTSRDALVAWVREQDPAVADLVERAWRDEVPAANRLGDNQHGDTGCRATTPSHRDTGDGILARLKRDDPALATEVVEGRITANAAARQKGWRKPRILLTSPHSIVSGLRKHLTDDEIAQIKELL